MTEAENDNVLPDNRYLDFLGREMQRLSPRLVLRHDDKPPFTWTYERWAQASCHEWPDRQELDNAMATWRKVSEQQGKRLSTLFEESGRPHRKSDIGDWLISSRRQVHKLLLRYRRARNLAYDEYQLNIILVPTRKRDEQGWLGPVPIDRIWSTDADLFGRIYDVTAKQYGDMRAFARDVERHYRAWHELRGGVPEPSPVLEDLEDD